MKKKNIVIAFAMLLLTGVALSTASYAWFTANTQIQLGEIDVQVQATNGIQVSTDATNWKATLTTADLRNAYYTGSVTQFPSTDSGKQLQPVSTDGTVASGKFNMFLGELNEDGTIDLTKLTEAPGTCTTASAHTPAECAAIPGATWSESPNAHFLALDLFIQSTNASTVEVGLLPSSNVNVITNGVDARLKSSIRVGFVKNGTSSTPAGAIALDGSANYTIWEPNAELHTTAAINNGLATAGQVKSYKGVTTAGTDITINDSNNFSDVPYQPNGGQGNLLLSNSDHDSFATFTTPATGAFASLTGLTEWSTEDDDNYPTIFTVSQGITKVRLYIWVEGQDPDCENTATLGSAVAVKLNFNAKATE